MVEKTHVFNSNLQKQLLVVYDKKAKLTSDKKSLITIIFGQCDDTTRTNIALCTTYKVDRDDEILVNLLTRLRTVCYKSNDGGISYKPYKMAVAVKSLHNFSNSKPNDPHCSKKNSRSNSVPYWLLSGSFQTKQEYWNIYSKQRLHHKIGATIVQ